jgi:hypothetical protein
MPVDFESTAPNSRSHVATDTAVPPATMWRLLRYLWCRHRQTIVTPKTTLMPAHTVCQSCGWREPVEAHLPKATSTWDSTRDEARYEREKRRRLAIEQQKQSALASWPAKPALPRRRRRSNVVEMKRTLA